MFSDPDTFFYVLITLTQKLSSSYLVSNKPILSQRLFSSTSVRFCFSMVGGWYRPINQQLPFPLQTMVILSAFENPLSISLYITRLQNIRFWWDDGIIRAPVKPQAVENNVQDMMEMTFLFVSCIHLINLRGVSLLIGPHRCDVYACSYFMSPEWTEASVDISVKIFMNVRIYLSGILNYLAMFGVVFE